MTREEIDAIFNSHNQQVNNGGMTRERIDSLFNAFEGSNNQSSLQQLKIDNTPVSSPTPDDQNIIDMNGNIKKAKVKNQESKHEPYYYNNFQQIKRANDEKKEIESNKQSAFARNNFQKTNEVLSGTGIPKGMTKDDVEIQKLYNEMNSTKNPNIKRNLQRTIDEKERVANQTLVSDDADEREI